MSEKNFGAKFLEVRTALGLSSLDFGARINVSPSYVNLIENGYRKPSARIVTSLFSELGISRRWWETGEGEMFADKDGIIQGSLTEIEINHINVFRLLDDGDKDLVISMAKGMAKRHRK